MAGSEVSVCDTLVLIMNGQRIDYIDWLKGLSIICVVWFHVPHPEFINFSFRMPLFFLLSGIFFKTVPFRTYLYRKTHQLLIPFIFFYLFYFCYMWVEYTYSPTHTGGFHPEVILDILNPKTAQLNQKVNPPLWFIMALINLQLLTYALVYVLKRKWLIMTVAILISAIGIMRLEQMPTYFMFGRSLRFLGYYVFGHLYGKQILGVIEKGVKSRWYFGALSVAVMGGTYYWATTPQTPGHEAYVYVFNISLVMTLILLFRYVSRVPALRFFHFFGRNSYAVLGLHYMIVQILYWLIYVYIGDRSPTVGIAMAIITLLLMVPVIHLLNRYFPRLVGKRKLKR